MEHSRPVPSGRRREWRRVVAAASVTLAVLGGILALVASYLLSMGKDVASEGNAIWTVGEHVYVWAWVVVGIGILCCARLLVRRPWVGVCVVVAGMVTLLLDVALLHPGDFIVHFIVWGIVALPLLIAGGLGVWLALMGLGESVRNASDEGNYTALR